MIALSRERTSADIEELVLLFVDQIVLLAAKHVAEKLVASFRDRIFSDEEESLVVGGPGRRN